MATNNSTSELVNLGFCVSHGKRITGREYDIHDLAELTPFVIRQTQAVGLGRYLLQATVQDNKICLPVKCAIIESVTNQKPLSWYGSYLLPVDFDDTNVLLNYNPNPEVQKGTPIPLTNDFNVPDVYLQGDFVPFTYDGHDLLFGRNNIDVDVVYTTIKLDEENQYPMLTPKGADALIYYAHYLETQKEYFQKLVDIYTFREAERLKRVMLAQARVPDQVTGNQLNELLNSMVTHNRKRFNIPYKTKW